MEGERKEVPGRKACAKAREQATAAGFRVGNAQFRVRCEGSKVSESSSPGSHTQIFRCLSIIGHKFGMVDTLGQLQCGP